MTWPIQRTLKLSAGSPAAGALLPHAKLIVPSARVSFGAPKLASPKYVPVRPVLLPPGAGGVGGTLVAVGWAVAVGGTLVAVGWAVAVGGTLVAVGGAGGDWIDPPAGTSWLCGMI